MIVGGDLAESSTCSGPAPVNNQIRGNGYDIGNAIYKTLMNQQHYFPRNLYYIQKTDIDTENVLFDTRYRMNTMCMLSLHYERLQQVATDTIY